MRSTKTVPIAALLAATTVAGCNGRSPVAYGDMGSIIVAAPDTLWTAVRDSMRAIMEPETFTVRDERIFELTHVPPDDPDWTRLREWRQVLVVGGADDPWVRAVLDRQDAAPTQLPAMVEAQGIWARGQTVTALVLPTASRREAVLRLLPELRRHFDERFRSYVLQRMFASGADTALVDTLRNEAGFELLVPNVYAWSRVGDAAYRFLNGNRNQGALDRSITVAWRDGAAPLSAEELHAWRESYAGAAYEWEHATPAEELRSRALEAYGEGAIEIQGVWRGTDPSYPMGGPFIARAIPCPAQDRTYLLDAWLYAPSHDKYEYMLQLETILDSFACGS